MNQLFNKIDKAMTNPYIMYFMGFIAGFGMALAFVSAHIV